MSALPPPRSGGKIPRSRRPSLSRTPYDRPSPRLVPKSEDYGNPNWISRLIFSPTRMIASGAGKVFSSVFGPDSPSDSGSDEDSSSEDELNDDNDVGSQGVDAIEKAPLMINFFSKEVQPIVWKSETTRLIERLLMQESFSREECDRLTYIIKSRVVDSSIQGTAEGPNLTIGNDEHTDLRSTAILEAKKWIEENKLGSSSKPELDHGICSLNTAVLPNDTEDQGGSPVDLAKSYMRERPPWASPSINPVEFKSPSSKGIQSFQEGTPYFCSGTPASSSKLNRDSPATGSWNITEELRRVRLKAAEEMLRTPSSSRIDWASFTSSQKRSHNPFTIGKTEATVKDKSLTSTQDAPSNLNVEATTNGLADGPQNETERLFPATFNPEDQDMIDVPVVEGQAGMVGQGQGSEGLKAASQRVVDGTIRASSSMAEENYHDAVQDSRSRQNNGYASKVATKVVAGSDGAVAANGVPSSDSSLSAGHERVENSTSSAEARDSAGSGHEKMHSTMAGETCDLLSEASVEVPVLGGNNIIVSVSRESPRKNHKEASQNLARPKLRSKPTGKAGGKQELQERKVSSRYNKRLRGRGK